MQNREKIEQILKELKFSGEEFDINDEKLIETVSNMLELKPRVDSKIFQATLRNKLLLEIKKQNKKNYSFDILKTLGILLSGAAFTYASFTITNQISDIKPLDNKNNSGNLALENAGIGKNTMILDDDINPKKTELKETKIESKKTDTISPKATNTSDFTNTSKNNTQENNTQENTTNTNDIETIENIPSLTENSRFAKISNTDSKLNDEDSIDSLAMSDTAALTNDDSGMQDTGIETMSIMSTSLKIPEFTKDEYLKGFSDELLEILEKSDISIDTNYLIIKTKTENDKDKLNSKENLEILKNRLNEMGYYLDISVKF